MIGVVKQLYIFFFCTSQVRRSWNKIRNTQPKSNVLKLKDLCRTRWIERVDNLDHIKKLYSSIVACFQNISAEDFHMWSSDSVTDASTLLLVITRTEFFSALVITNECLQYLRGLTMSLQEEANDIVLEVSEIKTLTSSFKQVRGKMCNGVGTTPSIPRICGRQHHRASIPASNSSEYFRRTITVPILDHLPSEVDKRLPVLVTEDLATVSSVVMKVGELYAADLPNVSW